MHGCSNEVAVGWWVGGLMAVVAAAGWDNNKKIEG